MAKNFSWGEKTSFNKKSDKDKFVSGKTNLIDYRIKKFVEGGLIKVERDNGEKIFILDLKRIKISNHKLPNGYKECILIKDKDEKWMIFQL